MFPIGFMFNVSRNSNTMSFFIQLPTVAGSPFDSYQLIRFSAASTFGVSVHAGRWFYILFLKPPNLSIKIMATAEEKQLIELVKSKIGDFPDFPKPGILFK